MLICIMIQMYRAQIVRPNWLGYYPKILFHYFGTYLEPIGISHLRKLQAATRQYIIPQDHRHSLIFLFKIKFIENLY